MYHAYLCVGLREYTSYGIGNPIQVVRTGDEDILYATRFQVGQDTHPESGTLGLAAPHTQDFFQSVLFEPDTQVHRLVDNLAVIAYLEDDTVHPYNQIYGGKRTVLPLQCRQVYLVGYNGYGKSREFYFTAVGITIYPTR